MKIKRKNIYKEKIKACSLFLIILVEVIPNTTKQSYWICYQFIQSLKKTHPTSNMEALAECVKPLGTIIAHSTSLPQTQPHTPPTPTPPPPSSLFFSSHSLCPRHSGDVVDALPFQVHVQCIQFNCYQNHFPNLQPY